MSSIVINRIRSYFVGTLPVAWLVLAVCATGCVSLADWRNANLLGGASQSLDVRFGLARMVERNGSLSDARDLYQKILVDHPDDAPTLHRLGVVSIQLDELDQAIDWLNRAAAIGQPGADLLGDLGYAYFLSGDLDSAESRLLEAVAIAPQDRRILNNLGLVVGYQGNLEQSLEWFRRGNSEAEAQSNLAYVLAGRGDLDAAKQRYHTALELDPNLKKAAYGLSEFYQGPRPAPRQPVVPGGDFSQQRSHPTDTILDGK